MNKRVAKIELSINAVRINEVEKATQGDTNTHFLHLTFMNGVELEGYNLQVTYMPPYPETVPYVDVYTELTQELDILIPNALLRRSGKVKVDFALSKGEEILTVNKSFTFEVIRTINGSSITAFPEGDLKLTLAQQIEKVTQLLEEAEEKVNDYNDNVVEKTNKFNENARTKTEEFNTNAQTQTRNFNENSNTKTNEFNTLVENSKNEIKKKATESADAAAIEANKQVVAQQEKSIKAVQEAGTSEIEKVTAEGNKQVQRVTEEGTKQIGLVESQGNTSKGIVGQAETKALQSIETAKTSAVQKVNDTKDQIISDITQAKDDAKQEIEDTKSGVVQAVTQEGTKQTGLVTSEGNKQIKAVQDKTIEEIEKVNQAGVNTVTLSKQKITQTKNTAISEMETAKNDKIQEIRNIKYVDINTNQQFRDWIGTQKEYDGTTLKTPETRYNIYDDTTGDTTLKFFRGKYPTSYYDPRITRIIQADNGKLTSWDRLGDMPIKREGNKPLDDYIVASGDWGTIYSDGIVTVEQLAPTTNSDYQIALSQLEEIQSNGINLLNEEGYTPFNFESLSDHEILINDINSANIKEINNIEYPITYQDSTTGEIINIEKPVLRAGTIPTPISFGCLVTSDNKIYTGLGYENYGKNVKKYGLENLQLISSDNGVSKYKVWGTVKSYKGICYISEKQNQQTTMEVFYETCALKARLTYKGSYVKPLIHASNSNGSSVKSDSIELFDGWYILTRIQRWEPKNQVYRNLTLMSHDLVPDTIINDGELFLEIDDSSFMYTAGQAELPTVPQGMIVPRTKLSLNTKITIDTHSFVLKGIKSDIVANPNIPLYDNNGNYPSLNINTIFTPDILKKEKINYLWKSNPLSVTLLASSGEVAYGYSGNTTKQTNKGLFFGSSILMFEQMFIYKEQFNEEKLKEENNKNIKMYEIYKNE